MIKKKLPVFVLLMIATGAIAFGESAIPYPLESYGDSGIDGVWNVLVHRASMNPLNLVSTLLFFCAIVHTFMASIFNQKAHKYQKEHEQMLLRNPDLPSDMVCYRAEIYHFLGEIEAVFGIWVLPLIFAIIYFHDWSTVTHYIDEKVNYVEPMFVIIIMAIASTRPVIMFAEKCLKIVASLGKKTPAAWWFSILTIGPVLGSFITEPAAMTISAMLLGQQFYKLKPSDKLKYATMGLLFVNISVGGTLTHFAAPPVLMVAGTWGWDIGFMMTYFGWKAVIGIIASNILYYMAFRKEFIGLKAKTDQYKEMRREVISDKEVKKDIPIPLFVTIMHMFFLVWTVFNLHHPALFLGGFLFFLAFTQVTLHHQYQLRLRAPLLVGFFLAGLVTHGTLQQWWIEPVLTSLGEFPLFISALGLTAFNDNAAITFLAQLVPEFAGNVALQKAVVYGAVAGGGLTIIANAPNPAGNAILSKYFPKGLSPFNLFLGAAIPTFIVSCAFLLL